MPSHDYEEFIAALNAHGVRYLVIGAHAVALHAKPRATKDLDLLLEPSAENASRVLAALTECFGGTDLGYTIEDLVSPRWIVQLGVAPVRIDLHSRIPGIRTFETAWSNRVDARFGAVEAHFPGAGRSAPGQEGSRKAPGSCRRARVAASAGTEPASKRAAPTVTSPAPVTAVRRLLLRRRARRV